MVYSLSRSLAFVYVFPHHLAFSLDILYLNFFSGHDIDSLKRDGSKPRSSSTSMRSSFGTAPQSPLAKKINKEKERRKSASSSKAPDLTGYSSGSSTGAGSDLTPTKPRTRPSYFKPTQSSRNKVNRNSDGGVGGLETNVPTSPISIIKRKPGTRSHARLPGVSNLASSKMAFYASTPNLFSVDASEEEEEEVESSKTKRINKRYSSSNLQLLTDLSRSVPDVNDAESETDTSSSSSGKPQRKSVFGAAAKITSRYMGGGMTDKDLMPPPSLSSNVPMTGKLSTWKDIARPHHTRKTSSGSEMTLDEAKSILRGKSGILMNKPGISADSTFIVAPVGASSRKRDNSSSSLLHQQQNVSDSLQQRESNDVFESTPSHLAVAEEIEATAAMLRHQAQANTLASSTLSSSGQHGGLLSNLEASPLDPPERDTTSCMSPKVQQHESSSMYASSANHPVAPSSSVSTQVFGTSTPSSGPGVCSTTVTIPAGSFDKVGAAGGKNQMNVTVTLEQDEEDKQRSVRDRIAHYNFQQDRTRRSSSPVASSSTSASSIPLNMKGRSGGRASSPYRRVLPASPNTTNSTLVTAQTAVGGVCITEAGCGNLDSYRSLSDTGVGSGSETDTSVHSGGRKSGDSG